MFNMDCSGVVTVTKGDSFTIPLLVNLGTNLCPDVHALTDDEEVYFAVMEPNQPFAFSRIRKVYTKEEQDEHGYIDVRFVPQDTQCLSAGKYYYQAKIIRRNSDALTDYDVTTFTNKTLLYLTE